MGIPVRKANEILDELRITSVQDLQLLEKIAFQRKAVIEIASLASAEARLVRGRKRSVIVVAQEIDDPRRRRFSIAHELGHLELHHARSAFPCDSDNIDDWLSSQTDVNIEQQANEFAAALLLPERFFAPLCLEYDISTESIKQLAEIFNTSLMATGRRYVAYCEVPAAIVWTQQREIRWFQRNTDFEDYGFFPNVHSLVDEDTIAARFFDNDPLPRSPNLVKASTWMEGRNFEDIYIQEQCIPMPNYNGVLSLLWVDEDQRD